jgi:hypothetical protein
MRCIECGAEMRMLHVARDDTMMVSGYEHHTLGCASCQNVERRLVFSRAKRSPTGRNVQISHEPDKAEYTATELTTERWAPDEMPKARCVGSDAQGNSRSTFASRRFS